MIKILLILLCQIHVSISRQSCANCLHTTFPSVTWCTVENSVAKALCFPISLGKYLVFAMLAPGHTSHATQAVCHYVEVSRSEGFGEPDSNPSWEDYEYQHLWVDSLSSSLGWLYTFGLTVTNYRTQAPTHCLRNNLWRHGSAGGWKTMQLAKKGGLRWHKGKNHLCSWHKNSAYIQLVSPIWTSIRDYIWDYIINYFERLSPATWWIFVKEVAMCTSLSPRNQSKELCDTTSGISLELRTAKLLYLNVSI